jgi:hypothetical protein
MNARCFLAGWLLILNLGVLATTPVRAADDGIYREVPWDALVPKGWDPAKSLKSLDYSRLSDRDPRAMEALRAMKNAWDNAPAELSMNGRPIRIAGFMIPLERTGDTIRSFLLVPYFGACIHSPPPPANQMIEVQLVRPITGYNSMDGVWVNGSMQVARVDSPWGKTAYRLKGEKVELYNR